MDQNTLIIVAVAIGLLLGLIIGIRYIRSQKADKATQFNLQEAEQLTHEELPDTSTQQENVLVDEPISKTDQSNDAPLQEDVIAVNEVAEEETIDDQVVIEQQESSVQEIENLQTQQPSGTSADLPQTQAQTCDTETKDHNISQSDTQQLQAEEVESLPSRMHRLRSRLAKSGAFGNAILSVLSKSNLSEADWEEIEDTLLMADLGMDSTMELMDNLRTRVKVENTTDFEGVKQILKEELLAIVDPNMDRNLNLTEQYDADGNKIPNSIVMVGVNGVGKTTTAGKLARVLAAENKTVIMGAADTFRAAATDQLKTWAQRAGVEIVASEREGADPASVAFEAVNVAKKKQVDAVIIDTAGRLQNKKDLMDELGKIKRVISRQVPVSETLLVLDATTGQNGMKQAEVFAQVAEVTGIVLTKLDGTAKGGIVVSVQKALGVPVKLVGLGEGLDDLAPFDPDTFVESLLA